MEKYLIKKRKVEEVAADNVTEKSPELAEAEPEKVSTFQFIQKKGDLFSCSEKDALAHCVSADMRMGKGIAVLFKQKFGGVQELKDQGVVPGGVAVLKRGGRFVYYLVTKEKVSHKPTYSTLQASLEAMKTQCVENGVESVSMPRIGCGLDGLSWTKVSDIIKSTFQCTNVVVTIFTI